MNSVVRRYRLFLLLALAQVVLSLWQPKMGAKAMSVSWQNFLEMVTIIPPIFLLLGLFDVWVPKKTIIRLLGERSGTTGAMLSLSLGAFSAGPLYAAFPVAATLLAKGCSPFNILIFIGAWSSIKIPMLLFEASAMGWRFMASRLILNIPGILIIAFIVSRAAAPYPATDRPADYHRC